MINDMEVVRNSLAALVQKVTRMTGSRELSQILAVVPAVVLSGLVGDANQILGSDPASMDTKHRIELLHRSQNDVAEADTLEGRINAVAAQSVQNYFKTAGSKVVASNGAKAPSRPGTRSAPGKFPTLDS